MTTGTAEVLGTVAEIPTKRQAEQLLADRLRPINSGHYRPSSLRTLDDYAQTIWLPQALPTLKYSTKRYYQYMLRVHFVSDFCGRAVAAYQPRRSAEFPFCEAE
jgi:hypothetical protein